MASKFTAGMKNVVEVLNQMWDAFAAGPYNALPLTGGTLTGPVTSSASIVAASLRSAGPLSAGPVSKYGYAYVQSGQASRWIWIATLPADYEGNLAHLTIEGVVNDGWGASTSSMVKILMGSRGGFYADWSLHGAVRQVARFLAYRMPDGSIQVCVFLAGGGFGTASFSLTGLAAAELGMTSAAPLETYYPPAGVSLFDTAASIGQQGYVAPTHYVSGSGVYASGYITGQGEIDDSFLKGKAWASTNGNLETMRLGVAGWAGVSYPGFFSFQTLGGNGNLYKDHQQLTISNYDSGSATFSLPLLTLDGRGNLSFPGEMYTGGNVRCGPTPYRYTQVSQAHRAVRVMFRLRRELDSIRARWF